MTYKTRNALTIIALAVLGVAALIVLQPKSNPTEERLKQEYAQLQRVHDWMKQMRPIWEIQLSSEEYVDSLAAHGKVLKRMQIVRDSIEIINGRDPEAWRKRPQ